MISEVHAALFVIGPTKSVEAQTVLLETIASEQQTAPTHGSLDERRRAPFSAKALAMEAGTKMGDPILWRLTPPKYWGSANATMLPIARILLHYEDIEQEHIAPVCDGIARLVDKLRPAYAALHFKWIDPTDEHIASMLGFSAKALHYCKFGPPGVFAWTWFGPEFVARFGMDLLRQLGAAPTPWGGASLKLVPEPWAVTIDELRERQLVVDQALRSKGFFGDYSRPIPQKGAKWTPLVSPPKGRA